MWSKSPISAVLVCSLIAFADTPLAQDDRANEREEMIAVIREHAQWAPDAVEGREIDPGVLEAMRTTPRHAFVPSDYRLLAYYDRPLPIGFGQTISQPFIVALMTDLLNVEPGDNVLEIGTGSGYQAAVLSALVGEVFTIEIVPQLGEAAAARLRQLDFSNVPDPDRRRLLWLAGRGAFRRHRGDSRRLSNPPASDRAAQTGRPHGHSGGRTVRHPAVDVG